jgi:uncharacterized membrane-anchored protein YjiN (DUF445 family)
MSEKKRNRLGSISLVAGICGFLIVELQPWLPLGSLILFRGLSLKALLEAFFEASMVGAFADWFAVSALFKDPLGIALPHTNILAKNKNVIADAVPRFLTGFVSPAAITGELGKLDYAARAAEALSAGSLREELHSFLRLRAVELLAAYGGDDPSRGAALRRFVDQLLDFVSERLDAPAEASALLAWARKGRFDERALEAAAEYARVEIGRNRLKLVSILTPLIKRNVGWQGLFIGTGTVERALAGIQDELADIGGDRNNEIRGYILSGISTFAQRLGPSGTGIDRDRMAEAFRSALSDEGFRSGFALFASQFLSRLGEDLALPQGRFMPSLEHIEDALAARLSGDEALRAKFNALVADLIGGIIERGKIIEGVTDYLAGLLRATDERAFVNRIEESIWNDLQYIRVNGAVVGGFVGLVITVIKAALTG